MKLFVAMLSLVTLVLTAGASAARAIPNNVKLAGQAMYAAAQMEPEKKSNKVQNSGSHGCSDMDPGPAYRGQYCKAWYRDFTQDLSYFVHVQLGILYVALRGTNWDLPGNVNMNETGEPIIKHGHRVHKGWWMAMEEGVWGRVKPLIAKYGKGREIFVTGHSMGGAIAAYLTRSLLHDGETKKIEIRLATFGAPRYTFSYNFFPRPDTFYVYTVEHLYQKGGKGDWRTDPKVFEWEDHIKEKYPKVLQQIQEVDLKRPKDSRDRVWTAKCKMTGTNSDSAHSARAYWNTAMSGQCD